MSFSNLPEFSGYDCMSVYDCITRIQTQLFGDDLEEIDLLQLWNYWDSIIQQDTKSSVKSGDFVDVEEFKVFLNVSQFEPEELEVHTVDNFLVVHGKHEEKCDAHGFISREFTRKYMLPKECEQEELVWGLIPNNVLVVQAPIVVPPVTLEETEKPMSLAEKILQKTEKLGDDSDGIRESALEISKKSQEMCRLLSELHKKHQIAKELSMNMK